MWLSHSHFYSHSQSSGKVLEASFVRALPSRDWMLVNPLAGSTAYKLVGQTSGRVAPQTVFQSEAFVRLYSLHTRVGDVIGPSHQLTLQGIP